MTIENERLIECTNDELFELYFRRFQDDIFSFDQFKDEMRRAGVVIWE